MQCHRWALPHLVDRIGLPVGLGFFMVVVGVGDCDRAHARDPDRAPAGGIQSGHRDALALPVWRFLLTPTLLGAIVIVAVAVVVNNARQTVSYPRRWL